ncbi:hypothetical protein GCM10010123_43740 [Pilimelia anulata]|uniref:Uncharacterized protein n=1 Tax=Pilimelia anulata TaxID=53371 RepID=A0A8J3BGJ8_9ACTN|nr:PAS domain-containing protein [Pilimelia anulata]GGK09134.1 hypothetical protein GCM10010123_43740 [Pilimelia anulata]
MAHVELSLSESTGPPRHRAGGAGPSGADGNPPAGSLARWSAAVSAADEPCLVLDVDGGIVAASAACHTLLGLGAPGSVVGRYLLDGVLHLVDFTAERRLLPDADIDAIPPLLALSSGRQTRGLMRVHDGAYDVTVDGIAVPLRDADRVVGSLTFFSAI